MTAATDYKTITVKPLSPVLGAEIEGVDLSKPLSNAQFDDIHSAFLKHHVIFFRDQALTPDQHLAFGRRWGTLNVHPYVKGMASHPEILEINKEPSDRVNFGGGWHSDMSFLEEPALGSILHAIEAPEVGGDTLFASQYAAWDALSPGLKKTLEGLNAIHSAAEEYGAGGHSSAKRVSMESEVVGDDVPEYEHPVVRTHPETGRKGLYINPAFTLRFAGWSAKESRPLLSYLFEVSRRESYTCRFRWRQGSVAMWDNRCVWHYALNDYHGQRRHMRRVTVNGDKVR
ncbi:MAG TPA: TauD/TfdA family dioxygenase [Hyphomonadaceae bacterium]|nr:TauD/TfdA family dioxygenase [Hyphomonadaceae bacterium]